MVALARGKSSQPPTPEEKADEDAYPRYLDEEELARSHPRPDLLFLLRRYEARSNSKIVRKLGGDGSERIVWRDDEWHLND